MKNFQNIICGFFMNKQFSLLLLPLILMLTNACQNKEYDKDIIVNVKIAGSYHALIQTKDSSGSYDVKLTLAMDSAAVMLIDYGIDDKPVVTKGKWHHEHEKIILELDSMNGLPMPGKEMFLFELINEDLVALEFDTTKWDCEIFELKRN